MKKNIFICLLFAIFFVGCECTNPEYIEQTQNKKQERIERNLKKEEKQKQDKLVREQKKKEKEEKRKQEQLDCERKKQEQQKYEQIWKGYSVIVINDCEYLKKVTIKHKNSTSAYAYAELAHKGNCKFCEERRKNEKKDTVFIIKHDTVYIKKYITKIKRDTIYINQTIN